MKEKIKMKEKEKEKEKIPSNVIIKTSYAFTKNMMIPRYSSSIIEQIMQYIKRYPNNYENLEIEAKLGRFEFKGEAMKNFEKINDIFIIPDSIRTQDHKNKYNFISGVCARNFYLIWSALEKESKLKGSNITCIKPMFFRDTIYSGNYNGNKRKSEIFKNGEKIKEETIRKENKEHINVRNNGCDFRITCSKEMPTEIDEKRDKLENVREKYRTSYQLSFFRVDLTLCKDKSGETFEVEIELNKLRDELIRVKPIDENNIRLILDRFIQNIFNLYSVLVPESIAYNAQQEEQIKNELGLNKHLKKEEINNTFGNYFQNNLFPK